jgi:hypothetical protein
MDNHKREPLAETEDGGNFRSEAAPTSSSRFALAVLKGVAECGIPHIHFQGRASAAPWISMAVGYGLVAWGETSALVARLILTDLGGEIYDKFKLNELGAPGLLAYAWDWREANRLLAEMQKEYFDAERNREDASLKASKAARNVSAERISKELEQPESADSGGAKPSLMPWPGAQEAQQPLHRRRPGRRPKDADAADREGFDLGCRWRVEIKLPVPYDIVVIGPGSGPGRRQCRLEFRCSDEERSRNPFARDILMEYSFEEIRSRAVLLVDGDDTGPAAATSGGRKKQRAGLYARGSIGESKVVVIRVCENASGRIGTIDRG